MRHLNPVLEAVDMVVAWDVSDEAFAYAVKDRVSMIDRRYPD